ncbi:MAG TPA: type I DNA topoisomerase [Candidatus Saccharimonadales bacterium]|nr:type I DNA topoisomerase [Candidatus Saccharimonadales bacterium]
MSGKNLVIVESPAKAKTIEKYLGKDFVVKSSIGHIRGLPSKNGSVDVAHNFKPKFEVDPEKTKVIAELKKAAKAAKTVWLASDEDREGEAIAWHVAEVLQLDPKTTKRIVFHEITKDALDEAVENPRTIDMNLVEAQQARQSLDYLVGFELSPVLWRKVRAGLSAGRVQSVAVRLVVEREGEIEGHKPESTFKLTAEFKLKNGTVLPAASATKFTTAASVRKVLEAFADSDFTVTDVAQKPGTRSPGAPFTTSTLQQEASAKLGYSPRSTMRAAQRLYEAGHITYMRTDSVNLSTQALGAMGAFIKDKYGEKYHQYRTYATKSISAQEAHEAIRPTHVGTEVAGEDDQQQKLYSLIWRRTLASQMAAAELENTTVTIAATKSKEMLEAKGQVVLFDGFLKVYGRSKDDTILPELHSGDELKLQRAEALENLSRGPARYTEATLVKKLEEMGIGRPSTYASTINTIQTRGYVERGDLEGVEKDIQRLVLEKGKVAESTEKLWYGKDSNKLFPTDTGNVVTDFLVKYFAEVMDYDFTKDIEEELDEIARSHKNRVEVLKEFYDPFHKLVEASADVSRAEATQARLLGKDPGSGLPIYARFGRFGPMLQKGDLPPQEGKPSRGPRSSSDDPKPDFAPLPTGEKLETVTLEQALEMFKLPRLVGQTDDGQDIKANVGRFGPYIQVGKLFVSIKPLDPRDISLKQSKELYAAKLKAEKEKNIADFGDGVKVLNGRFGPYVTDGTKNAKIPKETNPREVTHEQAKKLLAEAPEGKRRGFRRRAIQK